MGGGSTGLYDFIVCALRTRLWLTEILIKGAVNARRTQISWGHMYNRISLGSQFGVIY